MLQFYDGLLTVLRRPQVRDGQWRLLACVPAWEGNGTSDSFLAFAWQGADGEPVLAVVNYAPHPSQCYVRLPFPELAGQAVWLQDLVGTAQYDCDGNDLISKGFYLDLTV